MLKKAKEFLKENKDLENYRKEALKHVHSLKKHYKQTAEETIGKKIHKVHAMGSVTDKKKFHEGSDVDVGFHYSDHSKPEGIDRDASEKLQDHFVSHGYHHHLGVINTLVFNTHKK